MAGGRNCKSTESTHITGMAFNAAVQSIQKKCVTKYVNVVLQSMLATVVPFLILLLLSVEGEAGTDSP